MIDSVSFKSFVCKCILKKEVQILNTLKKDFSVKSFIGGYRNEMVNL